MNKVLSALKVLALAILFIFFAVWASSRWIITYVANAQFEQDGSGMELSIDSLSLNLFGPSVQISDLKLTMPNDNHVTFDNLTLELNYLPLFFQEVVVDKFVIDDLEIRYHALSKTTADVEVKEEETADSEPKPLPAWLLLVQDLHINNLQLDANIEGKQLQTTQTHLHINNTAIDLENSTFETEIDIAISLAAQLEEQVNKEVVINATNETKTSADKEENQQESGIKAQVDQFSFKTKVLVQNFIESPQLNVSNLKIATKSIKAQLEDIDAAINLIELNFTALSVNNLLNAPEIELNKDLQFTIDNINAVHLPSNSIISDINKISLNEVGATASIPSEQANISLSFSNFNIQDMLFLKYAPSFATKQEKEDKEDETVTLFTLNDLNLNSLKTDVSPNGTHVELASITFDKADVNALLHALPTFITGSNSEENSSADMEDQQVDTASTEVEINEAQTTHTELETQSSQPLASNDDVNAQTTSTNDISAEASKADNTQTDKTPSAFTFLVKEISHKQPVNIHLTDTSLIPEFEQRIVVKTLNVNQLSSSFLNTQANLDASINEYAQLVFDVNPNTVEKQKDNMLVDIKLSNFDLVSVSPYVKQAADMSIEKGNVDVNSILNINNEGWKGDIHLILKSLGVTTVNTDANVSLEDESVDFIPLNVLLDKIADSKGHLNIDLPIEGKNGELSGVTSGIIRNVVEIITTEAAKSYLIQTFVPYSNIVSIAQYAGNKMFEINIEDLVFPIGGAELPEQELKVFDAYAKLIKEQEDLVITVCPVSTWADIGIAPVSKVNSGESDNEQKLTEVQLSKLYELAKQREVYFKNQLIAQKADMSRLVSCATKISNSTDKAGYLGFTTKG